jgi:hypothetical protein
MLPTQRDRLLCVGKLSLASDMVLAHSDPMEHGSPITAPADLASFEQNISELG